MDNNQNDDYAAPFKKSLPKPPHVETKAGADDIIDEYDQGQLDIQNTLQKGQNVGHSENAGNKEGDKVDTVPTESKDRHEIEHNWSAAMATWPRYHNRTKRSEESNRSKISKGSSRNSNIVMTPVKSPFYGSDQHAQTPLQQDRLIHLTAIDAIETPEDFDFPDNNSIYSTLKRNVSIKVKSRRDGQVLNIQLTSPNQIRAFSRRALSYQKRQWFENICCISLCPMIMILLALALRTTIGKLADGGSSNFQIQYCSNEDSTNQQFWPVYNLNGARITTNNNKSLYYVNYLSRLSLIDLTGRDPIAQLVTATVAGAIPCVQWFGAGYTDDNLDVYSRESKFLNLYSNKDSLYTAETRDGWLDLLAPTKEGTDLTSAVAKQALSLLRTFVSYQSRPWSIVATTPSILNTTIGFNPKKPSFPNSSSIPGTTRLYFKPAAESNGILDTIEPRFYVLASATPPALVGYQQVPFFEQNYTTENSLSEEYYERILQAVDRLKLVPPINQELYKVSADIAVATAIFAQQEAVMDVPHTGLYFETIDHTNKSYAYTIQSGNNPAISNVQGFPGAGLRSLLSQSQLSNGILRFSNPSLGTTVITQGTRAFPFTQPSQLQVPFGSIIGRILYPLGISFLLPIFTLSLVREKENKILVMIRMNGMGDVSGYYISTYVTFFINYCVSSAIFMFFGNITSLELFTKTSFSLLAILLILWGNIQVCLAFCFNAIFRTSTVATVSVFILTVCGVVTSFIVDQIFIEVDNFPVLLYIWPPFLFYRLLDLLNRHATSTVLLPYNNFKRIVPGNVIYNGLWILGFEVVFLFLLAIYLTQVLPSDYGITRPWHFPITDIISYFHGDETGYGAKYDSNILAVSSVDADKEDDDVRAERKRIVEENYPSSAPLVLQGMRKEYTTASGTTKLAVNDIALVVENNVVFGLLGPNGAGKTSLISILTGVFSPTTGKASLAGFDIVEQSELAFRSIGVCPQFDILWPELSVDEHLYFYARLKGVSVAFEKEAVHAALELVNLSEFSSRIVKSLSGGERRRVSIAIALVSNPKVVFLDEPTTGLDPEVRRTIWDTIARARGNRAILMTTHSMEEAEVCCQTIAIMAKGRMRCIGAPTRLKQLYGCGYKLSIISNNLLRAQELINLILPANEHTKVLYSFQSVRKYGFVPTSDELATIFEQLVANATEYEIKTWGVSQTTLDEIFANIVSQDEARG